jgi:hypothetical protein
MCSGTLPDSTEEDSAAPSSSGVSSELDKLRTLRSLLDSFAAIAKARSQPPVIDTTAAPSDSESTEISGLSRFQQDVAREIRVLEKSCSHGDTKHTGQKPQPQITSNTPYLYALGLELLAAPFPIAAVCKTFYYHTCAKDPSSPDKVVRTKHSVKVDVVAADRWIRVVTYAN